MAETYEVHSDGTMLRREIKPKSKNPIKKAQERVRRYFKRVSDAKLARVEGYATGVDDATLEFATKISQLMARISQLTEENLKMEERLRNIYDERTSILETRYTDNCKKCMNITEAERNRLRNSQNMILDLIHQFNVVFMKIFKHANLVVDEHDNIIKSSGRVKASRDILVSIKEEADKIVSKVLPLTSIKITEDPSATVYLSNGTVATDENFSKSDSKSVEPVQEDKANPEASK